MDSRQIFQIRVTAARKSMYSSISEAARETGYSRNCISNWENGERRPTISTILDIAKIYNIYPAYLLGLSDSKDPNSRDFSHLHGNNHDGFESSALMGFNDEYLSSLLTDKDSGLLIQLTAEHSTPLEYSIGDTALIDTAETAITRAGAFAINQNGNLWIRVIKPELDNTYTVVAPGNNEYQSENMTIDEIKALNIIGRICWSGRKH